MKVKEVNTIEDARIVLGLFVVRARRVAEHSMVKSGEAEKFAVYSYSMAMQIGEYALPRRNFPKNEEIVESLASRLRPCMLRSESIYWQKVLKAIELIANASIDEATSEKLDGLGRWFKQFEEYKQVSYSIQIFDDKGNPVSQSMNNQLIADGWTYADLVHVDAEGAKASALALPYDDRYYAATSNYCALAMKVLELLVLVQNLSKDVDLGLPEDVWTQQVTYDGRSHQVVASRVYVGEPGTKVPDGDIAKAKGFTELTPLKFIYGRCPKQRAKIAIIDARGHVLRRLLGFYASDQGNLLLAVGDSLMLTLENAGHVSATYPKILNIRETKGREQEAKELLDLMKTPNRTNAYIIVNNKMRGITLRIRERDLRLLRHR